MRKQTISLLLAGVIAGSAIFALSGRNAVSEEEKKKEGSHGHPATLTLPVPPAGPTARPKNAKLYIVAPKDGKTVKTKFKVVFGLRGMGVAPAGIYMGAEMPTGHHHLIIDSELPDLKLPVPKDDKHLHFGGGQSEAMIELPPGKHTLQLLLGDHAHMPHDPPLVSEKITITVAE